MTDETAPQPAALPSAPPPAPPPAPSARIADAIAQWMREQIHNSPLSRHEPALNHLQSALPALEAGLSAALNRKGE